MNALLMVTSPSNSTIGTTITATCGAGKVATGGGFSVPAVINVTNSGPHAGDTGWDLTFQNNTGLAPVTVTAICVVGTAS